MDEVDTSPTATPLPPALRQVFVALMNEAISANVLMPFVGYYCAHLRSTSVTAAGFVSGILLSMFMLGQILSSRGWGAISDKYGRRPVLVAGLIISGAAVFCFGLAPSFGAAMAARFLQGFFNGNLAAAKSIIVELCDKSNEAKGFGMMGVSYGVGAIAGMAVGGLFYDPAVSPLFGGIPWVRNSAFLRAYPAFAPCLLAALYACAAALYVFIWLPETNQVVLRRRAALRPSMEEIPSAADDTTELAPRVSTNEERESSGQRSDAVLTDARRSFSLANLWNSVDCRNATAAYMLTCAHDIVFVEVFPLWAVVPRSHRGLGLSVAATGAVILVTAVTVVGANAGFSACQDMFGRRRLFALSAAICGTVAVLLPTIAGHLASVGAQEGVSGSVPLWLLLAVALPMLLVRTAAATWSFGLTFLAISKAAPREHLGAVNGLAQALGATCRMVLPPFATPLFAWSVSPASGPRRWPLDATVAFLITTFLASVSLWWSRRVSFSDSDALQSAAEGDEVAEKNEDAGMLSTRSSESSLFVPTAAADDDDVSDDVPLESSPE